MKPLLIGLGVVLVSAAVWFSATAKEEAGDASDRVSDVELIIACEELRSPGCRHLAVKAVASCVKFKPCRKALLARSVPGINREIKRALDALGGGDAFGSPKPKSSGSGLPGRHRPPGS